jgi:uncharacterized protein YndB with AHSA1/START domain
MDKRDGNTLSLTHTIHASVKSVWRCWSEPALLSKWFCPAPWHYHAETIELRPGGTFRGSMSGPEGQQVENTGLILDAAPQSRIVFTNMFGPGWIPQNPSFGMVAVISLQANSDTLTTYHAQAHHWSEQHCTTHENMGFFAGWHAACDQLDVLSSSLE